MGKYQVVDIKGWKRKSQYDWFSSFENPTYGFCVKVDVASVVNYSKETKTSFFANFLFIITRVINELEMFRLRELDGQVVLYDEIDPDFSVKTEDGSFNNASFSFTKDYQEFYKNCREVIEKNNKYVNNREFNLPEYGRFYSSCLTTIDILSMIHPIKTSDKSSTSVPRIFWDKYLEQDGKYFLNLNITVSHALVDGEDLAQAFNLVRKYALDFKTTIK